MSENRRITLKDIAKELGISVSTASRALNSYSGIAKDTIQLVKDYAAKHNYVPNTLAVNFRRNKTMTLGLIVPELVHYFFSSVISGTISIAKKHGYSVLVSQTDESQNNEIQACRTMLASGVDGLLISISNETLEGEHLRQFHQESKPVVQFDKVTEFFETPKVIVDDLWGAFNAVQHLIDQGYTKIAHINGLKTVTNSQERLKGYLNAMGKNNLPVNPNWILHCQKISQQEGFDFTRQLMESNNPPDAIFCITDLVAMGAMDFLRKGGYQIPAEVGVIGFSNWDMAGFVSPGLSSVDQHAYEMGQKATEILIELLQNNQLGTDEIHEIKTSLVIRDSSLLKSVVN